MRLVCTSKYRNGETVYRTDEVIDVSDSIGKFLLRDSPGSFRVAKEPKAEKPTEGVNRQQTAGERR